MNTENHSFGWRSIRWRFVIIISILTIIGLAGMLAWTTYKIRGEAEQAAVEKVRGDLQLGWSLLESQYPGPWLVRDGQLWKGNLVMNGRMEIVDEVGSKTGDTCTIFQGDTRVATNVMRDGKRAVGTKVADEVAKVVLSEGREYLGEADVVGVKYQTAYMPIRDGENQVVGIWYVGANKSVIDKMIWDAVLDTVLIFVSILVVLILALWKLTGTLIRPINSLVQAAKRLAEGNLEASLTEFSTDEIGYLSSTFEEMRIKLRKHTLHLEGMVLERTVELEVANNDLQERERQTQMELLLAARVQQDSLPNPVGGDKVRVGTIFEPYSTVSGDFFNYKWFKEQNKLCGYIIDVSGHGVATALQTATFKMMLDNVLLTGEKVEAGVLKIINKRIMHYLYEDTFVALLYFEFDLQAAVLKLISAGITLLLVAKPHECSLVPIFGCYLGIIDDPDIEIETIPLKAGEIYCMMSDGASDLIELHGIRKQGSFTEYMNWLEKLAESSERNDDFSVICIEILQENKETNVLDIKNEGDLKSAQIIINKFLERNAPSYALILEVAIHEALNNGFCAGGRVTVKTRRVGGKLIIRVKDYGLGFNTKDINVKRKKEKYEEEFEGMLDAEDGRGILLMKTICDKVIYNAKGNEVLLMKKLYQNNK